MGFSRKPPTPSTAGEFIQAADAPAAPPPPVLVTARTPPVVVDDEEKTPQPAPTPKPRAEHKAPTPKTPWEGLDPKATPKNAFNLRLNDYQMALIRHLAEVDGEASMQRICKRILIPALERQAGIRK